ncbi:alpha/beta fold hydrolase [Aureivirga sp. CE67]|uniref:alpha/beta fold hydrolase n=1 Tax=Aureivirga sp. CE67 TaxID=1788983 RepID=UPI0018C9E0D4|nr:alpha/beta hydrolase [Aureivirga sp. CE67]
MKRTIIKTLKVIFILIIIVFIGLVIAFYQFSTPKPDKKIMKDFQELGVKPKIQYCTFKDFKVREVYVKSTSEEKNIPTIVFVHGTPGSATDFKKYMTDSTLRSKVNMLSYDRVGFGMSSAGETQNSIAFDVSLLEEILKEYKLKPENTILAGYSYGGSIVLATKEKFKEIVLLAPAVHADVEPMPAMLNVYKWESTRWMVPKIWKSAAIEKMSHKDELRKYDSIWIDQKSPITVMQGTGDKIVPYENTLYLEEKFPKEQLTVITLGNAGHSLIWSRFSEIKQELLRIIAK